MSTEAPPVSVLIVEDVPDSRKTLSRLLSLDGHEVREAGDGRAGLESLLLQPPDVALVDVGLPGIDGYEVAERLRAKAGERRPYLVALTGYGQPEDRQRALASGFDAFMVKPVDPEALRDMLKTLPAAAQPFAPPP